MQITSQNLSSNSRLIHSSSSSSSSTYSVASSATNASTIRLQTSSSTSTSSLAGGSTDSGNGTAIKKTSSYDVKAFQKEAVLSYVKVLNKFSNIIWKNSSVWFFRTVSLVYCIFIDLLPGKAIKSSSFCSLFASPGFTWREYWNCWTPFCLS